MHIIHTTLAISKSLENGEIVFKCNTNVRQVTSAFHKKSNTFYSTLSFIFLPQHVFVGKLSFPISSVTAGQ